MKLTDYLAEYIYKLGVRHIFLVTGGAAAHIVDSLGKHKGLQYICTQHEQTAAMAAESYSRVKKNIGVAVVTSGPGATNLITGVCCAYFDSIPSIYISGQVNSWEIKGDRGVRQLGFQETDIIDMVRPITKYAVMVDDPRKIKYHLDRAVYEAKSGRPGPVWIDLPMDIQHAVINPDELEGYYSDKSIKEIKFSENNLDKIMSWIDVAVRPVIIAGSGIKLGNAKNEFLKFIDKVKAPVVSTWSGIDILPYDHELYIGQYGVYGNRAANFTVQNSDLLISIGSRLDTRQTGGQPQTFARGAKKIVVDIDPAELHKNWVIADLPIEADAKDFLFAINTKIEDSNFIFSDWLKKTKYWKDKYPSVVPEYYKQKGSVNPYVFIDTLSKLLDKNSIIIPDQGGNLTWTIQGFKIKEGQQLYSAFGNSPMGYALPASIGAAFADPNKTIICIDGDGGFQMNIQDLQTVKNYNLPIKIFILNNNSYGIIKQFQEVYFDGRYEATVNETGYSVPDFLSVANSYGISTNSIKSHDGLEEKIREVLNTAGPILCDVKLDESQKLIPKLVAVKNESGGYISKPIEDMVPLLPRDEFYSNMIIDPLDLEEGKEKSTEIN